MCPRIGDFYLYSECANEECAHCLWPWSLIIWGLIESYSTICSRMADWYAQLSTQFQLSLGAFTKIGDIALAQNHLLYPPTGYWTLRVHEQILILNLSSHLHHITWGGLHLREVHKSVLFSHIQFTVEFSLKLLGLQQDIEKNRINIKCF